jgi:uncharacterized repeat protein (TIGR01451 family)
LAGVRSDLDHDGTSYKADWPDGTAVHPASVILGAPNDRGVGPLNAATSGSSTYDEAYDTITFQTTEATSGAFYPFWSEAGTGASCRFNLGNDIPGTTTTDFGKASQYGTTIQNPCFPAPDLTITKSHTDPFTQGAIGDTCTITVSNVGGAATIGTVTVADALPASFTATAMSGSGWTASSRPRHARPRTSSRPAHVIRRYSDRRRGRQRAAIPINTVTVSGGNEASNVAASDIAKID